MISNISFPSGFTKQSAARNKEILAVNRGELYLISPLPSVIGVSLKDVHLLSNSTAETSQKDKSVFTVLFASDPQLQRSSAPVPLALNLCRVFQSACVSCRWTLDRSSLSDCALIINSLPVLSSAGQIAHPWPHQQDYVGDISTEGAKLNCAGVITVKCKL